MNVADSHVGVDGPVRPLQRFDAALVHRVSVAAARRRAKLPDPTRVAATTVAGYCRGEDVGALLG
jgi:hypothetical protein